MALLQQIRRQRAEKQRKQPFRRHLFANISALVKEYGLGKDFLSRLVNLTDAELREKCEFYQVKPKKDFAPPLFSLSTVEEYRVTLAIMTQINNPYLYFAHSPEEILLCGPLFGRNPSLGPDKLARYHFATLLLAELAQQEVDDRTLK